MLPRNRRQPHTFQRSFNRTTYHSTVNPAAYQPPKRRLKPRTVLIVTLLIVFSVHLLWAKHVSAEQAAARQAEIQATQKADNFASQVNTLIDNKPDVTFNVTTYSATNGLQQYGADDTFDGASTAKLLTAADYLHHIQTGTATLDQSIDGHSAKYWLQAMLVNSDDTAWAELNGYLTHADLKSYANSIGFTDYDPDVNTFTARDVATLLQKLYSGSLLDPANRSLMLNYLGQANYRNYIVAAVPDGDAVYHKIGIDNDTVNDAAIIANGQHYLVLVIFTDGNGTYDWNARAQLMQTITRDATAAYL